MTRIPLAGVALLGAVLTGCPAAEAPRTDSPPPSESPAGWLLGADAGADLIRAADDEAALRRRFGDAHVRADTVWVGEGMFEPGTIIHPDDPRRRLAVQWEDPQRRARPTMVRIAADEESAWSVYPGVTLGTTLEELEEMNGAPFDLYGLGWDYAGTVADWRGGRLAMLWGDRVILRLHPLVRDRPDLERRVLGDRVYSSVDPVMRELHPVVHALIVRPR